MNLTHNTRSGLSVLAALALLAADGARGSLMAAAEAAPPISVILWFDTEDYLLPASDDSAKRLGELLTERGIRATFKVVGEKARVLERRGRLDVIGALKKHDIGYHSDFHSVHPTPTEYLADCGWPDGIAEFMRREGPGAADVRRIFGVPTLSCYGQPGSSWGPQATAALKQIGVAPHGVPCYVDEGSHVGLDGKPFWYAGALHVFHMNANVTRMSLHDPLALEPAKKKVTEIADRLRQEGGGLISIYYHPCEWVHQEFWDGVNFLRGANPARENWQPPRQRSAEETDTAFKRFAEYVDHIRTIPGVRWVTASDLPLRYPDLVRTEGATEADLDELARRIGNPNAGGVDYQRLGSRVYSVADQFGLLTLALNEVTGGRAVAFPLKAGGLFGPDAPPPPASPLTSVDWFAFRDAARAVHEFIKVERRVPARVFVGAEAVAPADFLAAMAAAWRLHRQPGKPLAGQTVPLGHDVRVVPERHVAKSTPDLFGGWVIHKAGFQAPKLMELARLQAWTLKPATAGDQQAVRRTSAEWYRSAYDKRHDHDFDGAIADASEAIKTDPDNAKAWLERGISRNNKKDFAGALEDYNRAVQLAPEWADGVRIRGEVKARMKDYVGAIADYNTALKLLPKFSRAYGNRAEAYHALGKDDLALADYNTSIELDGKSYPWFIQARESILRAQGKRPEDPVKKTPKP